MSRRRPVPENAPGTLGLRRAGFLVALSQDHHAALVHAQALTRAADGRPPYHRPDDLARVARDFLRFREADLLGHFSDEEEVLLPAAKSVDPEGVARVLEEHREISALAAALQALAADSAELRPTMRELGTLLHDHIRYEERRFFENLQRHWGPEEEAALGRSLEARREARGHGPACAVRSR